MEQNGIVVLLVACLAVLDPPSSVGAAGGCLFFAMNPTNDSVFRKSMLAVVSFILGYSAGVAVKPENSMWVSLVVSSVAVVILGTISRTVGSDRGLPLWISEIISILRGGR